MRRLLIACALACAAGTWLVHAQPSAPKAAEAPFTLTVDNIMKGPKLVGNPPTNVRFLPDSSKIVFSWQKPDEDQPATYIVDRDGTGLTRLTPEEARKLPPTPTGRLDPTRKLLLTTEGGDIVVYDMATHARRPLMRTAEAESNPRWARGGKAVTFVRGGNLFLVALDPAPGAPSEVQLTDIPEPGARAGAGGQRGGQARGARGEQEKLTASQRILREQEFALIEHVRREEERLRPARRRAAQLGLAGAGSAAAVAVSAAAGAGAALLPPIRRPSQPLFFSPLSLIPGTPPAIGRRSPR